MKMKKVLGVVAFGTALLGSTALSGSAAFAGQNDDPVARLNAVEQENAAMRKKSAELAAAATAKPVTITDKMADFFGTYAADLPVAYKARPPVEPGRLTLWGEAGAIWTGGDPVAQAFSLTDFTTFGFGTPIIIGPPTTRPAAAQIPMLEGGGIPGIFDLNPKIGWEAATGFDYKFAGSPWHVSGQFRYGEGGKASGSASSAGTLDPSILALINSDPMFSGKCPCSVGGSESLGTTYREAHWLADLALGWDIVSGPSYVQVKGGLRVEEFVARFHSTDAFSFFINATNPTTFIGNTTIGSITFSDVTTEDGRTNFLGAGPVLGLEGSARFMGAWSFDYKGDLAVLFGTQNFMGTTIERVSATPAILNLLVSSGNRISTFNDARFVTMLSPDIQVGVSYWFTPNLKMSLSYRVDALIAVKNQKSANADDLLLPQRFWHGPRVGVSGTF